MKILPNACDVKPQSFRIWVDRFENIDSKKGTRTVSRSHFILATLLFLSLNAYLIARDSTDCFSPVESAARSFDYSGIEKGPAFCAAKPNVLLLGSSLLINPEWKVDRALPVENSWARNTICSASSYHLAQGLTIALSDKGMKRPRVVYSLAAGGALISDSYLLLSHYLDEHRKPEVVVIDCAPRSFNDSGVVKPTSTVIFKHCFSFKDFFKLSHLYVRRFDEKINHVLERICFVYHHRQWLSKSVIAYVGNCATGAEGALLAMDRPSASAPVQQPNRDAESNVSCGKPLVRVNKRFDDSLAEYKYRYSYTHHAALQEQMTFLEKIAILCESRDIKLVVLNMPLHRRNLSLLPAGFYEKFQHMLSSTIGTRAAFKNLASLKTWTDEDYDDSVHLNEIGGKKLNELIADAVNEAAN